METITSKVQRTLALCMELSATGKAHAFCDFAGHTRSVFVRVYPVNTHYFAKQRIELIAPRHISLAGLAGDYAHQELDHVIRDLEKLLKEYQEAAA